jgi:hypothetical protein
MTCVFTLRRPVDLGHPKTFACFSCHGVSDSGHTGGFIITIPCLFSPRGQGHGPDWSWSRVLCSSWKSSSSQCPASAPGFEHILLTANLGDYCSQLLTSYESQCNQRKLPYSFASCPSVCLCPLFLMAMCDCSTMKRHDLSSTNRWLHVEFALISEFLSKGCQDHVKLSRSFASYCWLLVYWFAFCLPHASENSERFLWCFCTIVHKFFLKCRHMYDQLTFWLWARWVMVMRFFSRLSM